MQNTAKQKTTLVQSPLMTLSQETRWAYSTMLQPPEPTWGGKTWGMVSRYNCVRDKSINVGNPPNFKI